MARDNEIEAMGMAARLHEISQMMVRFRNRQDAGRQLASRFLAYAGDHSVLVLGLPRGGVPVAFEVARLVGAPLDVFVVRKLGVPGHRELAMGAIASGGVRVLNEDVVDALRIPQSAVEAVAEAELREIERQEQMFRGGTVLPKLAGRTIIVVDDGLATGSTMRAAVGALRQSNPARIIVAVPVAAADTVRGLEGVADSVVCLRAPVDFQAVSVWYEDFTQTSDAEVCHLLDASLPVARTV